MRILQIGHNFHVTGGSDAVLIGTTRLLTEAGHEVIPFCMASDRNAPSAHTAFFPRGADTRRAPIADAARYFYNVEARRKLSALLARIGPVDVAHLHIYHGKQTPAILPVLRRAGIGVIQTLHEYKLACPVYTMSRRGTACGRCAGGNVLHAVAHRCKNGSLAASAVMAAEFLTARALGDVRLVDRFLCVSDFQRDVMAAASLPADKLHRLHNFVPVPREAPAGHAGYILYFGRIEALKGIGTLLDAVDGSGQELVIAGEGAMREAMMARIGSMPNVRYAGFAGGAALQALIAGARVVVVPSEWNENCPMTVLEAKALGRPVVGARIGGIPELVRDGVDGLLFAPGDARGLRAALAAIDDDRFAAYSAAAHRDALARFSADAHLAALTGHYRAVLPRGAMQQARLA